MPAPKVCALTAQAQGWAAVAASFQLVVRSTVWGKDHHTSTHEALPKSPSNGCPSELQLLVQIVLGSTARDKGTR